LTPDSSVTNTRIGTHRPDAEGSAMRSIHPMTTLLCLAVLACADPTAPETSGRWGGPDATLVLAASGGSVEYACGTGTVDPGWRVGEDGRWTATGQHFTGGGPVSNEGRPPHAATYAGTFRGDDLTFTVAVPDLAAVLGPFRVKRDAPGASEICL
jgi:hypothetical protein